MSEKQSVETITAVADDLRQNINLIRHISAVCSGRASAVLRIIQECEKLKLTPEQMDIGKDIVQSINEHGDVERSTAAYYLIRYGMLLERGWKDGNL